MDSDGHNTVYGLQVIGPHLHDRSTIAVAG